MLTAIAEFLLTAACYMVMLALLPLLVVIGGAVVLFEMCWRKTHGEQDLGGSR